MLKFINRMSKGVFFVFTLLNFDFGYLDAILSIWFHDWVGDGWTVSCTHNERCTNSIDHQLLTSKNRSWSIFLLRLIKEVRPDVSNVTQADEFEYKDPVDGSILKHKGIRYLFEDGSWLVNNFPCWFSWFNINR